MITLDLREPEHPVRVRIESHDGSDRAAIRAINEAAFGGKDESALVDSLREHGYAIVSMVAELDRRVVGHVMFSRMWIETADGLLPAVALAPVAVLPQFQRRGIGGQLIRGGLELLRGQGEKIVTVVGNAAYYERFGFSTERARLLQSPFPSEAFMALELSPGALEGVEGPVVYSPAFGLDGEDSGESPSNA